MTTLRVMLNRQRHFLNGGRAHRSRMSNFIREPRSFPACSGKYPLGKVLCYKVPGFPCEALVEDTENS